jgi:hypothetical protein
MRYDLSKVNICGDVVTQIVYVMEMTRKAEFVLSREQKDPEKLVKELRELGLEAEVIEDKGTTYTIRVKKH